MLILLWENLRMWSMEWRYQSQSWKPNLCHIGVDGTSVLCFWFQYLGCCGWVCSLVAVVGVSYSCSFFDFMIVIVTCFLFLLFDFMIAIVVFFMLICLGCNSFCYNYLRLNLEDVEVMIYFSIIILYWI